MSASIDILNPEKPKRVAFVASNPSVSKHTGLPIGFWWSELTNSYWQFTEHGYQMDIYSPDGEKLLANNWSDPRDGCKYSVTDLISLGFICSPDHNNLLEISRPNRPLDQATYDAAVFVCGQGPMYAFYSNDRVHQLATFFYQACQITAVLCHATCIMLKTKLTGKLLVGGKKWTGFANSEKEFANSYVRKRIRPLRIEDEAKKFPGTNLIVSCRFAAHAVRDGNLITGQQQFSGAAVARLTIDALGV